MVAGIAQIVNRVEQRAVQIKDNGHRLLLFTGFCLQRYEKKMNYASDSKKNRTKSFARLRM